MGRLSLYLLSAVVVDGGFRSWSPPNAGIDGVFEFGFGLPEIDGSEILIGDLLLARTASRGAGSVDAIVAGAVVTGAGSASRTEAAGKGGIRDLL